MSKLQEPQKGGGRMPTLSDKNLAKLIEFQLKRETDHKNGKKSKGVKGGKK